MDDKDNDGLEGEEYAILERKRAAQVYGMAVVKGTDCWYLVELTA